MDAGCRFLPQTPRLPRRGVCLFAGLPQPLRQGMITLRSAAFEAPFMETLIQSPPLTEEDRINRYGYRLIPRLLPNGRTDFDRVGLTLEDLLHPQMGDVA